MKIKVKFNTKLVLSFAAVLVMTILAMGFVTRYLLTQNALNLGENIAESFVLSTANSLDSQLKAKELAVGRGLLTLEEEYSKGVNPQQLVEKMKSKYDLYSTIFEKEGNDFVRVATTIPTKDGSSAIGTKLARNSEVFSSVSKGNSWKGVRKLMGIQSVVAYQPINGNVVLYVGVPLIDGLGDFLSKQQIGGRGYTYIFSKDGVMNWHPDPQSIGEDLTKTPYGPILLGARNEMVAYPYKGKNKYAFVYSHAKSGLNIGFGLSEHEVLFGLDTAINAAAVWGGLTALLLSSVVAFVSISSIRKDLGVVESTATSIAQGDYDVKALYAARDNIRKILDGMEAMGRKIKEQIADVQEKSHEARLAQDKAEDALQEVTASQAILEEKNAQIVEAAKEAESLAQSMAATASQLAAQFEHVNHGTENQKTRITEVVTAMGQMSATVVEVARNAASASGQAEDSNQKATRGMEIMSKTIASIGSVQKIDEAGAQAMNELSLKADAVGGIVGVIEDIADQTNLLALNAAIEAARAGDAGRGFAVVADEVRKLAEKTMSATQQVNGSISEIQSAVSQNASERAHVKQAMDRTVEFAEEVNAILQDIVASVSQSSDMATGIATATEEQSAAAEQITSNVEVVDRISAETAEAMLESSNVLGRLTQLASNLDATIKSLAS